MTKKLQEMLDKQSSLQKRLGTDIDKLTAEEAVKFIKEHSIHATQELHEMLYELPFFKGWKDYSNMTNEEIHNAFDNARKEFIDYMHFNNNIALALGLNEDDIYELYMNKNKENHQRQDEGYTHDKQYR